MQCQLCIDNVSSNGHKSVWFFYSETTWVWTVFALPWKAHGQNQSLTVIKNTSHCCLKQTTCLAYWYSVAGTVSSDELTVNALVKHLASHEWPIRFVFKSFNRHFRNCPAAKCKERHLPSRIAISPGKRWKKWELDDINHWRTQY